MKNPYFRLYYRQSDVFGNSDLKIEIHHNGRWLNGYEIAREYYKHPRSGIGERLDATIRLLQWYHPVDGLVARLLSRKQAHLSVKRLPLDELKQKLGWELFPYPEKFGYVKDVRNLFANAHAYGVGIDVSNNISSRHTRDTNGLALKGITDKLENMNIPYYLYVDRKTWRWVEGNGWTRFLAYLESFHRREGYGRIITAPKGMSADDLMTYWADAVGQHQITRDELDEYDTRYDWLLHGAERGEPRIHKFFRKDKHHISIPNFGLDIEIPERFR